jgi:carbon starvation protein CstA
MALFFICVALLIAGYFTYGMIVDRVFGPDPNRVAPAVRMADGVDYVAMPTWKIYLIQLLNIAGLGPIFGPIMGALYGPSALLWVVFGTIFAGAVHDYFSGMLSLRHDGDSVPNVVGRQLGNGFKQFMNYFSVVLLVLVGVVFVTGPGQLLSQITGWPLLVWVVIIFCYYFLATMMPIDKIIGRLYPFFGALLLFMSFGLIIALLMSDRPMLPQGLTLENLHPKNAPIWPLMFITIACGAISGFHSTQSPLMARCVQNEKHGRLIFYGAMVGEGIIGLIWATLGLSFYESAPALGAAIAKGTASGVVFEVSSVLLGGGGLGLGAILAILGVVVLPITSGDTAFRAARVIVAEIIKLPQGPIAQRLYIAVPMFAVGAVLSQVNFTLIWQYFGWSNQTLAAIVLWAAAAYLAKTGKLHWICTIPAMFMTAVTFSYIAYAPIGFSLPIVWANWIGIGVALVAFVWFYAAVCKPAAKEAGAE